MHPTINKTIRQASRLIVVVVGFTILLIVIAKIVLPGPALIIIPLSLGILETELIWARKSLDKIKNKIQKKEIWYTY